MPLVLDKDPITVSKFVPDPEKPSGFIPDDPHQGFVPDPELTGIEKGSKRISETISAFPSKAVSALELDVPSEKFPILEPVRRISKGIVQHGLGIPAGIASAVAGAPHEIGKYIREPKRLAQVPIETGKMIAAPFDPRQYSWEKIKEDPVGTGLMGLGALGIGAGVTKLAKPGVASIVEKVRPLPKSAKVKVGLPGIEAETELTMLKSPGPMKETAQKILAEPRKIIRKQGDLGKQFTDIVDEQMVQRKMQSGEAQFRLRETIEKVSPEEFSNAVDVIKGIAEPMSANVEALVPVIQGELATVASRAKAAGLEIKNLKTGESVPFEPRANYYPQKFEPGYIERLKKQTPERKEALNHLLETGQAENLTMANTQLSQVVKREGMRREGNLQYSRTVDLPGYRKDPGTIFEYLENAYDRITQAELFGARDQKLYGLAEAVDDLGGQGQYMKKTADFITGKNVVDYSTRKALNKLRTFETITKLDPITSILNISQRTSIPVRTSMSAWWRARKASKTPEGIGFAERSGVSPKDLAKQLEKTTGRTTPLGRSYLKKIGMIKSERTNRIQSANAGKFFAEDLFASYKQNPANPTTRRLLEELGIKPESALKRGTLSLEELKRASIKVTGDTQFFYDALDLPVGWQGDVGKTLTQFKPAAFRQTQFVNKYVLGEAKKGRLLPMVKWIGFVQGSGEIIADLRALVSGRERPSATESAESLGSRMLENFAYGPGWGLPADVIISSWKYGKGLEGTILGPGIGDIAKGVPKVLRGPKAPESLAKYGVRQIPFGIGKVVAPRLFKE